MTFVCENCLSLCFNTLFGLRQHKLFCRAKSNSLTSKIDAIIVVEEDKQRKRKQLILDDDDEEKIEFIENDSRAAPLIINKPLDLPVAYNNDDSSNNLDDNEDSQLFIPDSTNNDNSYLLLNDSLSHQINDNGLQQQYYNFQNKLGRLLYNGRNGYNVDNTSASWLEPSYFSSIKNEGSIIVLCYHQVTVQILKKGLQQH